VTTRVLLPAHAFAGEACSAAWLLHAFRAERIVPIIPNRADQPPDAAFDRHARRLAFVQIATTRP